MRETFNRQLTEMRQELVYIYANIDLALHDAVDALSEGDKDKAKAVKAKTRERPAPHPVRDLCQLQPGAHV